MGKVSSDLQSARTQKSRKTAACEGIRRRDAVWREGNRHILLLPEDCERPTEAITSLAATQLWPTSSDAPIPEQTR